MTARELSERLTAAGWPVTVNSVNGIFGKKGRESISVTQLIALARALDVSPAELLFPLGAELIEVHPTIEVTPSDALLWFFSGVEFGDSPPGEDDPNDLLGRAVKAALRTSGGVDGAIDYLSGAVAGMERVREQLGHSLPGERGADQEAAGDGTT